MPITCLPTNGPDLVLPSQTGICLIVEGLSQCALLSRAVKIPRLRDNAPTYKGEQSCPPLSLPPQQHYSLLRTICILSVNAGCKRSMATRNVRCSPIFKTSVYPRDWSGLRKFTPVPESVRRQGKWLPPHVPYRNDDSKNDDSYRISILGILTTYTGTTDFCCQRGDHNGWS